MQEGVSSIELEPAVKRCSVKTFVVNCVGTESALVVNEIISPFGKLYQGGKRHQQQSGSGFPLDFFFGRWRFFIDQHQKFFIKLQLLM